MTTTGTSDSFGWQVFGVVMGLVALFAVLFMFVTSYQVRHHPDSPEVAALNDRVKKLVHYNHEQDEVLASIATLTGDMIGVQENQQTMLRLVARSNGLLPQAKHRQRVVQQK